MISHLRLLFLILSLILNVALAAEETTLQTVRFVDINRYMGTWYVIAQLNNRWEVDCNYNTRAIYSLKANGTIHAVNECQKGDTGHARESSSGIIWVVDHKTNAKLKISFVPTAFLQSFFNGDYWIIALAEDYSYAVVSEPTQSYLWILSRTPALQPATFQKIINEITLKAPKINTNQIIMIKHDPSAADLLHTP